MTGLVGMIWAMRCLRSAALRPFGLSPCGSQATPAAAIAGPSRSFIELTRNIELAEQAPRRFEPTVKQPGDLVL